MDTLTIQFDGGCRPTNPGNKYGSYRITRNGITVREVNRMELGRGTNNEAEFESLLVALEWLDYNLRSLDLERGGFRTRLLTDSMIVRNRICGNNRTRKSEPEQRMFALTQQCLKYLVRLGEFKIEWQRREHNVAAFGH